MQDEQRKLNSPSVGTRAARELDSISISKLLFFIAAFLSFAMSVFLFFSGDPERGIFVGLWVPSILSAGTLLLGGARRE